MWPAYIESRILFRNSIRNCCCCLFFDYRITRIRNQAQSPHTVHMFKYIIRWKNKIYNGKTKNEWQINWWTKWNEWAKINENWFQAKVFLQPLSSSSSLQLSSKTILKYHHLLKFIFFLAAKYPRCPLQ